MKIIGKIILINPNDDEHILFQKVISKSCYEAELICFASEQTALQYLYSTDEKIFLILCSYNLLRITGVEFKKEIEANDKIRKKAIPFLFYSLSASKTQVSEAYKYNVQGFFIQPLEVSEQVEMVDNIIAYWLLNLHPNN